MKMRTLLAAGSIGAVASLGGLGVAGAATTHHAVAVGTHRGALGARIHAIATTGALPASFSCAKASSLQAKITMAETRLDARLSQGQTAEQNAMSAGQSNRANHIALRLAKGQQLKGDLATVSGLITAQCK